MAQALKYDHPPPGGWPRITIVTPSYNQGWALERCLRSVLDQEYPNVQLIVMDGGSQDESVNILTRYQAQLAHWQSSKDGGQSQAICAGMERADGAIVGYLNSDDVLEPTSLKAIAHTIAAGARWIVGWSRLIDENDLELMRRSTLPLALPELITHRYVIPQESTFMTRELYDEVGGIDPSYRFAMDAHLWMRLLSICEPYWMTRYLGCFRVHTAQKTNCMDHYWSEFARAVAELGTWRAARGLPPVPVSDMPEWRFGVRKGLYYLRHTGPLNLWRIRRFRKKFRA